MGVSSGLKKVAADVVPDGWSVKTLLDLADGIKENFDDGDWIESEHITDSGVRLIQTGDIGVGCFVEKDLKKYIYEESFISLGCKLLRVGDLLICRLADPAGRACVFPGTEDDRVITSVDVTIFRPLPEKANRTFLANVFSMQDWFRDVGDRSGGTTHKRIARGALGRIPIKVPPLIEQDAIAAALSHADALIESLAQLITKKRQIKQGAMQELLTGSRRLPGFTDEWRAVCLKEILEVPVTDGPHLTPEFLDQGIPFLSVNNLIGGRIDWSDPRYISDADHNDFSRKCKPRIGDILFGKAASVGKVAIVESDIEFNIWSPIALIRVGVACIAKFVYYQLQSQSLMKQTMLMTNASSQGNIGMGDIERLVLRMPGEKEQTAISDVLSDMDAELSVIEEKLAKARYLKQGMMQELLTGRIRLV